MSFLRDVLDAGVVELLFWRVRHGRGRHFVPPVPTGRSTLFVESGLELIRSLLEARYEEAEKDERSPDEKADAARPDPPSILSVLQEKRSFTEAESDLFEAPRACNGTRL